MAEEELNIGWKPEHPLGVEEEKEPPYTVFAIIAITLILSGGFYFLSSSPLAKQASEYKTNTLICESFEDSECKKRDNNLFMKEESIFIATEILPNVDKDLDVDLLFTADMVLPNGNIISDVKQHNFKKTIPKDTFSSYLIELTPDTGDVFGEYTIILRSIDNLGGYRKIIEKTFTLYNGAR